MARGAITDGMWRVLVAAVIAAALPAPARADDWTTFGFDNARTGHAPGESLDAAGLTRVWEYDLGGVINAQPLYSDGVVFAGSERGQFAALDADSGTPLWTRRLATVDT